MFFVYKEDRVPVLLMVVLSVADFAVYCYVDSILWLVLWTVLGVIPKANIGAWTHHHQHCFTFRQAVLNRALETLHFFHVGISTHLWWLHHVLGHHKNYLDQTLDESRWKTADGRTMAEWQYTFSVAGTAYSRAAGVGLRYRKYLPVFVVMLVINLAALSLLIYYRPLQALLVYVLPMAIGLTMVAHATYQHHAGLDTDNPFEASHNITDPMYNLITGNLGYHTAHHLKGALHWSRLPQFHASIAHKIPPQLYDQPGFPYTALTALAHALGWSLHAVGDRPS